MFSWICPQCGREVPPSKTECPYCAERAQQAAAAGYPPPVQPGAPPQYAPPAGVQQTGGGPQFPQGSAQSPPAWQPPAPPPPPPPPVYQAPPHQAAQGYPPQYPPQYQQPPQQGPVAWPPPPQRKPPPPTWVMGAGFAVVFLLILGGAYYFMSRPSGGGGAGAGLENPTAAASKQKVSNPLQKSIEITGLRFVMEKKAPAVKFAVVNHGGAEIAGLAGTVTLWASTSRSEEDSIGSFKFTLENIGPGEMKELTAPLKTKLKMYELPDWQNATAEIQITSPAAQ